MRLNPVYDAAIVGGGLAGLATAIQLARAGHSVVLFEKETYPFHKVCGEYISLESRDFLISLGLPLDEMELPQIDTLVLTAPNGNSFTTPLTLGGFGISRYRLDALLSGIARRHGVHVAEGTRVESVEFNKNFYIQFRNHEYAGQVQAIVCAAAWGKRSGMDLKWKRDFLQAQDKRLDNYIGVKYHIRTSWPANTIGLHNFEQGYCGISRIEGDEYCLCYLARAEQLKKAGSIEALEKEILSRNPQLKKILEERTILESFPVTISQISFAAKTQVEHHVLMTGDAAGMITPLCGNGMSIALHTGKIAAEVMHDFLRQKISRGMMEHRYKTEWQRLFARRLRTGRVLQGFFGGSRSSNLFVRTLKALPFLAKPLIRMTHGRPF